MLAIFLFLPIIINIFSTEISYSNLIFLFLGNLIIVFSGPVNQALIIFNLQKYLMKILLNQTILFKGLLEWFLGTKQS